MTIIDYYFILHVSEILFAQFFYFNNSQYIFNYHDEKSKNVIQY